jgi:hypothetical protein
MKPVVRILVAASAIAVCLFLWLIGDRLSADNRREVTCSGLETIISDSLERKFISPDDIRDWMNDYGTYLGLRLDSVDLKKVEAVIDGKSSVRKSQAWLTDDGVLHVSITQREPVVRFQGASGGFYADADGYLFPLQNRHTARVPVVGGALPIKLGKGYKGLPETEKEQEWVASMLGLVRYLGARKEWNDLVGQITVRQDGKSGAHPREERSAPLRRTTGVDAKFERIRKYYEGVAPTRETPYRTVDVRFDGQIICTK